MPRYYPALLDGDARRGYDVVFPDLPGCTSAGATLGEAIAHAGEALAAHVESTRRHGEPVPEPGSFDALPDWLDAEDVSASVRTLIPLEPAAVAAQARAGERLRLLRERRRRARRHRAA